VPLAVGNNQYLNICVPIAHRLVQILAAFDDKGAKLVLLDTKMMLVYLF
jgi:hypothetical protein